MATIPYRRGSVGQLYLDRRIPKSIPARKSTNVSSGENRGPGNDPVDIWQMAIMLIVNIIYPQASLGAIIYTLLMSYFRGGMIFISSTP